MRRQRPKAPDLRFGAGNVVVEIATRSDPDPSPEPFFDEGPPTMRGGALVLVDKPPTSLGSALSLGDPPPTSLGSALPFGDPSPAPPDDRGCRPTDPSPASLGAGVLSLGEDDFEVISISAKVPSVRPIPAAAAVPAEVSAPAHHAFLSAEAVMDLPEKRRPRFFDVEPDFYEVTNDDLDFVEELPRNSAMDDLKDLASGDDGGPTRRDSDLLGLTAGLFGAGGLLPANPRAFGQTSVRPSGAFRSSVSSGAVSPGLSAPSGLSWRPKPAVGQRLLAFASSRQVTLASWAIIVIAVSFTAAALAFRIEKAPRDAAAARVPEAVPSVALSVPGSVSVLPSAEIRPVVARLAAPPTEDSGKPRVEVPAKPVDRGPVITPVRPVAPPAATALAQPQHDPAPPASRPEFDRAAARIALGAIAGAAASCRKADDPTGSAWVAITFAPSGRVISARVTGAPFQGTATGACIASTFRTTSVPAFGGDPVMVLKEVSIR